MTKYHIVSKYDLWSYAFIVLGDVFKKWSLIFSKNKVEIHTIRRNRETGLKCKVKIYLRNIFANDIIFLVIIIIIVIIHVTSSWLSINITLRELLFITLPHVLYNLSSS